MSPVEEAPYEAEDVLQELLARFPTLLAGDDIEPESPRCWLFVSRELAVPDSDDGPGRGSLDHLYLDQDGTPTFVECKRSSDTRGRREVAAQMLDYAANGSRYWSLDTIRQAAARRATNDGTTLDQEVDRLLSGGPSTSGSPDAFWQAVESKLRTGEVRLVLVADVIAPELRRLVEFLNEQMPRVEVLALEVRQYVGSGQKVLVPRIVGRTEAAAIQKSRASGSATRRADRTTFLASCTAAAASFFGWLLDEAAKGPWVVNWGSAGFSLGARSQTSDER